MPLLRQWRADEGDRDILRCESSRRLERRGTSLCLGPNSIGKRVSFSEESLEDHGYIWSNSIRTCREKCLIAGQPIMA